MKFLNDRILINVSGLRGSDSTCVYTIDVIDGGNSNTIFIGNVFLASDTTEKTFDITDVVLNYRWIPVSKELENTVSRVAQVPLKVKFRLSVTVSQNTTRTGESDDVILCYKYPHYIKEMYEYCWLDDDALNVELQGRKEDGTFELTPRYPLIDTENYHFQVVTNSVDSDIINIKPQDGYTTSFEINEGTVNHTILSLNELLYSDEKIVLPYTTGARDNCGTFNGVDKWINFPPAVGLSSSIQYELYMPTYGNYSKGTLNEGAVLNIPVVIDDTMEKAILRGEPIILNFVNGTNGMYYANIYLDTKDFKAGFLENKTMNFSIGYVAGNDYSLRCRIFMNDIWNPNTCVYVSDEKAAFLDECPAPFYLQWQDRMGSFQSQPFNGKYKFNIEYDKLDTIDYQDRAKLSGVNTTSKWTIYSDYITESLFPYYESIFVSPYLILYDTKNDISYEVKVSGNWTEKHYREGRKMIYLELELEEVKKQKMIY